MKSVEKQQFKKSLKTGLISAVITIVFMYLFYYPGWQSIAAGLCIGFLIPVIISLYTDKIVRRHLIKLNLLVLLSLNTLVHLVVIFVVAIFFVVIFYMKGNFKLIFDDLSFFYNRFFIIGIAFGLGLSLIFNFFSILNTLTGRNMLGKLFIGMYRNPIEVNRVFMFLDIKSSTSIAEQIGHLKFLSLVNDFFYDIAEPVRQTKGEIYKYVGDEAIVTWKTKDAIAGANCIRCFSLIESVIKGKSDNYMKKYGIVPEFKAGIHGGLLVTGELGYTRREIAYMGDVLNTAARIEEVCKSYDKKLLISKDLADLINDAGEIQLTEVGKVKLRGKEKEMLLFSI